MKSAEEWHGELRGWIPSVPVSQIRAIQADALRHAAEICEAEGERHDSSGACCYISDRIKAEAAKLEKPDLDDANLRDFRNELEKP